MYIDMVQFCSMKCRLLIDQTRKGVYDNIGRNYIIYNHHVAIVIDRRPDSFI